MNSIILLKILHTGDYSISKCVDFQIPSQKIKHVVYLSEAGFHPWWICSNTQVNFYLISRLCNKDHLYRYFSFFSSRKSTTLRLRLFQIFFYIKPKNNWGYYKDKLNKFHSIKVITLAMNEYQTNKFTLILWVVLIYLISGKWVNIQSINQP